LMLGTYNIRLYEGFDIDKFNVIYVYI
jgi:hypothetical protein